MDVVKSIDVIDGVSSYIDEQGDVYYEQCKDVVFEYVNGESETIRLDYTTKKYIEKNILKTSLYSE